MDNQDKINIHISSEAEMNKAFIDVWQRAQRNQLIEPEEHLYFLDAVSLLKVLSNQRLLLLSTLLKLGRSSIRALSKKLGRNYSNVYNDIQILRQVGLVKLDDSKKIFVPWNKIHTEIDLAA